MKKVAIFIGASVGILLIFVVGFILIQFIPYGRDHTNPPVVQEPKWDSPTTLALARRACLDCHSYQTTYPWFTSIAPASWLVQLDIDRGRRHLKIF